MKTNRQKSNWILDTRLFAGFLIAFALDWTGLSTHQWIGIAAGLLASYHLVLHRDRVKAVTSRFFGRTSVQARMYYLLDLLIMTGFFLIVMTGLVVSTWLNLALTNYTAWSDFHVTLSVVTLLLVVLKIGMHWRWIVRVARQSIFPAAPQPIQARRPAPLPAAASGSLTRRDFLKLMALVGTASLAAVSFTMNDNQQAQAAVNTSGTSTSQSTTSANTTGTNSSDTQTVNQSCFVQCNRRCSYPGGCHRYQDSNGNNRCDFSECS